ncbi:unnamed protein product [Cylicocyclus nassatus]|uniref:Phosphoglycerate mutase family protein n=1 Tax=Cylicocyclus nassatus TaxID=53992 RepID=A0AA36DVP2_CYLNA|nr:unnamed protein product [Cylicocyclus nassatus]
MGAEITHLEYTPEPDLHRSHGRESQAQGNRGANVEHHYVHNSNEHCSLRRMNNTQSRPSGGRSPPRQQQQQPKYYNIEDIVNSDMDTMVDVTDKESSLINSPSVGRKIAVVRHAESMNEAFPQWHSSCVNQDHYTAKDLNHPIKLPHRSKGLMIYDIDPPLTQLATSASNIVAKALFNTSIKWDRVISAPELASVQTAAAIALVTTGDKAFITIDETLYDFRHGKIDFVTPMELMKFDITVKVCNPPRSKEDCERKSSATRVLGEFERMEHQYLGNLIIVVGPATFDAVLQRLIGNEKTKMKKRPVISPLTCVILEKGAESWKLHNKQILPITTSKTIIPFDPASFYSK